MADALLGVVTEAVLTQVISLANEEISAVWGVEKDLQSLATQLELIQALLSDAESKSTSSKAVQLWLKDLEDAATDADDLLDEFAYQLLTKKMLKGKRKKVRSFFSSSNPLGFRFKMASEIKKIKLQMKEIFENANQIGLRPAEIMNFPTDPRKVQLTARFVDDSKIVGRGNDVRKIVRQLICSEDEKELPVIGIVGMGGQGKTTVAQLLMKNEEVNKHFEKTVWTCVSDDFDVDRVLNDMLQFLTRKESKLTNREAIVEGLGKELKGKRFLLVLDDVWNENSQLWDNMNDSLQAIGGSNGSKIIVTTRNEVVVTKMNGFVHRLGVLSGEDSQELFEKLAFGNGSAEKNPRLVEIGKRIVDRCGGVPLALKAIGGSLSSKRDELEWLKIAESSIWSELGAVQYAIKLSFDHLPSLSLKQCFAYCSVFPKDLVIEKNVTIQQWMAHGLLNPSSRSDLEMEDIGNNYFKILLQRSLLQEAKFDEQGNITSCKMHDLVHDFALETSKEHCLTAKVGELSADTKAVHLSIVCDGSDKINITSEKKFCRLRTLHLLDGFSCENFLVHCKRLRVLTLADGEMDELPISVAKMKHLRYLDISRTGISALPEFISKLYNLQTLRLPDNVNLPKDFARFVKLRHLGIKGGSSTDIVLIPGFGEMTSLRTLSRFKVRREEGCQIKELCNLKHLEGRLIILGLENVANEDDARRANLSGKRNIGSLDLVWLRYNTEGFSDDESVLKALQPHECLKALNIQNFMGKSLPSWMLLLHNMTRLTLKNLKNCEQIAPLGHLRSLEILHIYDMRSVKCVGNDFYGCPNMNLVSANSVMVFPSLKELTIRDMSSLEEWSFVSSSSSVKLFPSLKTFEIDKCPCLTRLPEGLLSASTGLERLLIRHCQKLVSIPDLSSVPNLTWIILQDLGNCKQIPPLGHFPFLEVLSIRWMRSIKCVGNDFYGCLNMNLVSADSVVVFPSLKELSFIYMDILEEWSDMVQPSFVSSSSSIELFPSLENFEILCCPCLTRLPEGLLSASTGLRSLRISTCDKLLSIPDLSNLHSLNNLDISACYKLVSIPDLSSLHSLNNLEIRSCNKLVSIPDLSSLHSLNNLKICACFKLVSIPDLSSLHSLKKLHLFMCSNLLSIPDLSSLLSLKTLHISYCCNPDSIPNLSNLRSLEVLEIATQPELSALPRGIEACRSLQNVTINCPASVMESLRHYFTNLTSVSTCTVNY